LGIKGDSLPPQAAAAYFHLYGLGRDDVDSMLETFAIVKRKDEQALGAYRARSLPCFKPSWALGYSFPVRNSQSAVPQDIHYRACGVSVFDPILELF